MEKTYTEKIQIHKKNKLAGLYPSVKALVVLLYAICCFILSTVKLTEYELALLLIPWFLVIPVLCAASGAFNKCLKAFRAVSIVALVIFLAQSLLIPGGETVLKLGFLKVREQGLRTAITLSFMVMDIAGIFVWMFQTTENKEFSRALENSGMNYKATYVFISTLQMIEILGKNSKTIMNAQRARGVETEGNVIVRMKAFFPSLVPLVLGAVISSEERVLTLEARGFDVACEKTHLFNLEKSGIEKQVTFIAVLITIVLLVWRIYLWIA
jgi:energy-coupling factor transport system permease protein